MSVQCPKCFALIPLGFGDRLPPWCPKCGADVKPDQFLPAAAMPYEPPPPQVAYTEPPAVVTTVTGSGPKPWMKAAAAPKTSPPAREPRAESPAYEPLPETTPQPLVTPDDEARNGLLKAAGVILLLVAAGMAADVRAFIQNGRDTTGRVVTKVYFSPGAVIGVKRLRLEYAANGKIYDGDPGNSAEGDTVPLVYEVKNPENIRRGTPGSLYLGAAVVAAIGGGLIATAVLASNSLAAERERAFAKPGD